MYYLSNTRITQNGIIYLVPCPLLPYLDEIKLLIGTDTIYNIFLKVAAQHNIVLIQRTPLKTVRQQPPAEPIRERTTQAVDFFMLKEYASGYDTGDVIPNYRKDTEYAKYVSTFIIKAETTTFANMQLKSAPLSGLFKGIFPKSVICTAIDDSTMRDFVGIILENNEKNLVLLPCIHTKLLYLYTPPESNINVFFKNIGCGLDQNSIAVLYKYTGSTDLNIIT